MNWVVVGFEDRLEDVVVRLVDEVLWEVLLVFSNVGFDFEFMVVCGIDVFVEDK